MRSLMVKGGDLVLAGGRARVAEGRDKLMQDLGAWVLYPLGANPLAPGFGTSLSELIGGDPAEAVGEARSEVRRVLANYQAAQLEALKDASVAGELGYWSRSEILGEVGEIEAEPGVTSVLVRAPVTAYSGGRALLQAVVG